MKRNGTTQIQIDIAVIKTQIAEIHSVLLGDDGLVKTVRKHEGIVNRAIGYATAIAFVISTITSYLFRGHK